MGVALKIRIYCEICTHSDDLSSQNGAIHSTALTLLTKKKIQAAINIVIFNKTCSCCALVYIKMTGTQKTLLDHESMIMKCLVAFCLQLSSVLLSV